MDTDTPPISHAFGVDMSDFASPPPSLASPVVAATQPPNPGGLARVHEADDEDNIPGAKAIRANGNGGAPRITYTPHAPTAENAKPTGHVKPCANTNASKSSTSKNGPRRLADTKPCSYPNLLITRSGDTTAASTNGHTSNVTTPSAAPDSVSVHSANSSGSISNHSKSHSHNQQQQQNHHHRHHHRHLHRQASSDSNGKESKCSLMW